MMRKGSTTEREKRRGERCTDATLAVALVDAEHRDVSPDVTFAMGRLLADYDSDGMGYTLSICLWGRINCQDEPKKENWEWTTRTRKER
jgi:hypothetical protein